MTASLELGLTGWKGEVIGIGQKAFLRMNKGEVEQGNNAGNDPEDSIPPELPEDWRKAAAKKRAGDIDELYKQWTAWNNGKLLDNPKGAFLGFCRKKIS